MLSLYKYKIKYRTIHTRCSRMCLLHSSNPKWGSWKQRAAKEKKKKKKKRKKIIETNEYDRHTLLMSDTTAFSLSRTVNQARRADVFFMLSDKIHKTVLLFRGGVPCIVALGYRATHILVSLFRSFR